MLGKYSIGTVDYKDHTIKIVRRRRQHWWSDEYGYQLGEQEKWGYDNAHLALDAAKELVDDDKDN